MTFPLSARLALGAAALLLMGEAAVAQSPGGGFGGGVSSATLGAQTGEMESRALLQVGRQGGTLIPKDRMADCDADGAHIGQRKTRDPGKLPTSLLDEMREREETSTVVLGDVYSFGCK